MKQAVCDGKLMASVQTTELAFCDGANSCQRAGPTHSHGKTYQASKCSKLVRQRSDDEPPWAKTHSNSSGARPAHPMTCEFDGVPQEDTLCNGSAVAFRRHFDQPAQVVLIHNAAKTFRISAVTTNAQDEMFKCVALGSQREAELTLFKSVTRQPAV